MSFKKSGFSNLSFQFAMRTIESILKIPKQIEMELDTIRGLLRCSKCGQELANNGEIGIQFSNNHSHSIQHRIDQHFCQQLPFKYDFNSPLTIKEQYALAMVKNDA